MSVVDPVTPLSEAETWVLPPAVPDAKPVELTVATEVFEERHCTDPVIFAVVLSL